VNERAPLFRRKKARMRKGGKGGNKKDFSGGGEFLPSLNHRLLHLKGERGSLALGPKSEKKKGTRRKKEDSFPTFLYKPCGRKGDPRVLGKRKKRSPNGWREEVGRANRERGKQIFPGKKTLPKRKRERQLEGKDEKHETGKKKISNRFFEPKEKKFILNTLVVGGGVKPSCLIHQWKGEVPPEKKGELE